MDGNKGRQAGTTAGEMKTVLWTERDQTLRSVKEVAAERDAPGKVLEGGMGNDVCSRNRQRNRAVPGRIRVTNAACKWRGRKVAKGTLGTCLLYDLLM